MEEKRVELGNDRIRLKGTVAESVVSVDLQSERTGFSYAEGICVYRLSKRTEDGTLSGEGLKDVHLDIVDQKCAVVGKLLGLEVKHELECDQKSHRSVERISISNPGRSKETLIDFAFGLTRPIADPVGRVHPDLCDDRFVAVPFRHTAMDEANFDLDFTVEDLIRTPGRMQRNGSRPLEYPRYGNVAGPYWASEGWAWIRDGEFLLVAAFSQERMFWSTIAPEFEEEDTFLRFGGASMAALDPHSPLVLPPGGSLSLGVVQYEIAPGGMNQAYYAFRSVLDENGCRFPPDFDPPVHWNELYDNPEWSLSTPGAPPGKRMTRPRTYTRSMLEAEAAKARDYRCESLYLDPGWDTDFGTLVWGEEWLGPRKDFVDAMREQYGLGVSLHCPLATWMSKDGRGVTDWSEESFQMDRHGNVVDGAVCIGSKQYLDAAEERLVSHCADGVTFLMFDGNWWNGGCWNPNHGHPVPFTMEDQIQACVDLAQRVHRKYPAVLIEMHDMIAGGTRQRFTPAYYRYGLPGSYDENWGFELMWKTMDDIKTGRARTLFYYNLGCNVPVYLHIDLRDDNENCLVLWWYASTCRHLGIGGTHPVPEVAEAQKRAMATYARYSRFFKRGDFFAMNEEVHIHVLPDENSFVVNLFNLSDQEREIGGSISVEEMGIQKDLWYDTPKGGRFHSETGRFTISRKLGPWSTELAFARSIGS